ncbi:MAG: hypothetical protein H7Z10_12505 [Gemmatimonadaceae bacterium]|nr:hypothetical protein [Acetobacteraceae bacterium]
MTNDAKRLLAAALAAHGGLERWRSLDGMSSTIVTGGRLWGLKGIQMDATPRVATTGFHRQSSSITPFGDPRWTMRWTPERVVIEGDAGQVIAEREDPRGAFAGHVSDTPWDPLHLAYFNGYAMWTYHALPFVLAEPGYEVADVAPVIQDGMMLRGLSARFPDGIHTHTREQRFYFGADGLLRRQDYEVEVWADTPATHLLSGYVEVGGLRLPTSRNVYLRRSDGSVDYDFSPVTVAMSDYILHRPSGTASPSIVQASSASHPAIAGAR